MAVLKHKKSKSSQFRYLDAHRQWFAKHLRIDRLPSRSTYFERYKRAWRLLEFAIGTAGCIAIDSGMVNARCVAADQSVIRAHGPLWNQRHIQRKVVPRAADLDATWSRSAWHGWTLGYSYEVIVSAEKAGAVWRLLASADPASHKPNRTLPPKVERLHPSIRYLLADSGYDSTDLADLVEIGSDQKRTGRRLLCPYPACTGATYSHQKLGHTPPIAETMISIKAVQRSRVRPQFPKIHLVPVSETTVAGWNLALQAGP